MNTQQQKSHCHEEVLLMAGQTTNQQGTHLLWLSRSTRQIHQESHRAPSHVPTPAHVRLVELSLLLPDG